MKKTIAPLELVENIFQPIATTFFLRLVFVFVPREERVSKNTNTNRAIGIGICHV